MLGVLQGATEFLPVSSSGHLVLAERLLGLSRPGLALETGLHLGTLLAVIAAYPRDVRDLAGGAADLVRRRGGRRTEMLLLLLAATVPAALAGVLLEALVDRLFGSLTAVALGWCVSGLALLAASRWGRRERAMDALRVRDALVIGSCQAFALAPGVSRAGITLIGGLGRGLRADEAARFSFLLSLPTVAGAVLLHMGGLLRSGGAGDPALWVGIPVAAVTGFCAIRLCLRRLRRPGGLSPFGWYCLALGVLCLMRTTLTGG